jgi:hypothetical protein
MTFRRVSLFETSTIAMTTRLVRSTHARLYTSSLPLAQTSIVHTSRRNMSSESSSWPLPRIPSITLNDGCSIPALAFGTGSVHQGKECSEAIVMALNRGFGSLDCAQKYGTGASVGKALERCGQRRDEIVVLTKCELAATRVG